MTRIFSDADVDRLVQGARAVEVMEAGYRSDAHAEVVPFPRSRTDASGVTLAWMGAAIPKLDVLGFRAYLYSASGSDLGEQVVALYRFSTMELKALFLGRRVGVLRTGAAVAAALHLAEPDLRTLGLLGTGTQARQVLRCASSAFRLESVRAWSPNASRRAEFRSWAQEELQVRVDLSEEAREVVAESAAIALTTSSDQPVLTPEMLPGPRLLVSISGYRRPEIALPLLEAAPRIWTDSVAQASGPGTLFAAPRLSAKLCPLAREDSLSALQDGRATRIVLNTGAAWEEVLLAESIWRAAPDAGAGVEVPLEKERGDDDGP
jgi:ornithine cyclodeaminase/alanine dehydrogenase-like protein (mu-crystallin family)